MATISYPGWADTDEKKLKFLERAEELYRKLHNSMGKWWKTGLTLAQYNNFPTRLKNKYPYTAKLSDVDWKDFQFVWEFGHLKIVTKLQNARGIIWTIYQNDNTLDVDIERDII